MTNERTIERIQLMVITAGVTLNFCEMFYDVSFPDLNYYVTIAQFVSIIVPRIFLRILKLHDAKKLVLPK